MQTLTQKFWTRCAEKYPGETTLFNDWMAAYKAKISWLSVFSPIPLQFTEESRLAMSKFSEKAHKDGATVQFNFNRPAELYDLPDAIQLGIFLQYVSESDGYAFEISIEFPSDFKSLAAEIEEWFCQNEQLARDEHLAAKYDPSENDHQMPDDFDTGYYNKEAEDDYYSEDHKHDDEF